MKIRISIFLLSLLCAATPAMAQNDYLVNTSVNQRPDMSEEEQFIATNFPMQLLCKWTPGMKFLFNPEPKDRFIPILCSYESGKSIDNNKFKYKIFEYSGAEVIKKEIYTGTNYTTHFLFDCEGGKYYHEIKGLQPDEICEKNPRASINGFVYLKDVDTAKELLTGKVLYTLTSTVRIDDPNSYSGYRDIAIPKNQKVTVTAVGAGSKESPVKLILEDAQGKSYYMEVALSRTNSGMDVTDFQAEKRMKYFANAFCFNDPNLRTADHIRQRYMDQAVYPKKSLEVKGNLSIDGNSQGTTMRLLRFTSLIIKDIQFEGQNTLVTLTLQDTNGRTYKTKADLRYDYILKNDNFIEDLFAFGNIREKHTYITDENWTLIAQGVVKPGMSTDECRLALGRPTKIELKKDSRFETWFYNGKVLEFESGTLLRTK